MAGKRSILTALSTTAALVALAGSPAQATPTFYEAILTPFNPGSNVQATFFLTLDGTMLTVQEHATGLEPGQMHPQHIHGLLGADAPNTTPVSASNFAALDVDNNGYVDLAEGKVSYGPILLDLATTPGTNNFPIASASGVIDYTQTFDLSQPGIFDPGITAADLFPLTDREIVIHGESVPAGIVGADPGSELDGTAGYKAVLPIADGKIFEIASPVPEPASLSLLGAGITLMMALRRRRRAPATTL